ncbi:MAG: penicillin-binding protein 2 [Patescibacteria group bacterium]|jgi:penicillin-binding protein 2|nr:penicillin-binding protein 2 [Patescibacteria group bacterium]
MKLFSVKNKNNRKRRLIDSLKEKDEDPFLIKEGKFDYKNLKDSVYYSDWTEEAFLSDTGGKETVSRSFDYKNIKYFFILFIVGFLILIIRAFSLQIISYEKYALLAESNRSRQTNIEAKRGIIYDSEMKPLVRNKANFVLYFRPIDMPSDEIERDGMLRNLANYLQQDNLYQQKKIKEETNKEEDNDKIEMVADNSLYFEMQEKLSKIKIGSLESYQPLFIKDNIDYDKAILLNLKEENWPGVFVSDKISREYLYTSNDKESVLATSSLPHLLGYTGKINEEEYNSLGKNYSLIDYVGKTGLEYKYEKELKGIPGFKRVEVDALGRQKKVISESLPQDGYSLKLSLDLDLQLKAEEIIKKYLEENDLSRASFVALDPRDGSVLSMVSLPSYDNNKFIGGISQDDYNKLLKNPDKPLLNRSISGEYPSGSTIKPIFAAGALEEEIITEWTTFLSTGGLRIGRWFFPDWRAGGHGRINVKQAIANSVNTFFYYIGGGYGDFKGLGVNGLVKYSRLFGLGEKTGIDLSNEADGFIPTPEWKREKYGENWYVGDTYHFAIGQGFTLVTPLQVASYASILANGGTVYKPYIVKEILDVQNEVVEKIEPEIVKDNIISQENMKIVREGMRETTETGSAASFNRILPVKSAGKTGTAQWSTQKDPHAWYMGFAPYEEPEIAFMVLVEEGYEGSTMAAPIARDILLWYFNQEDFKVEDN